MDKITPDHISSLIERERYETDGLLTICIIQLRNGYKVVGKSACANPDIYNYDKGMKVAYDDAYQQIWPLEGYLLKQKLYEDEQENGPTISGL
jgi:hypothetical protein